MMRPRDDAPVGRSAPATLAPFRALGDVWPLEEPRTRGATFEAGPRFAPSLALLQQQQSEQQRVQRLGARAASATSSYRHRRRHCELHEAQDERVRRKRRPVELDGGRWGDDWMERSAVPHVPHYYDTQQRMQRLGGQLGGQRRDDAHAPAMQSFPSAPYVACASAASGGRAMQSPPADGRATSSSSSSPGATQRAAGTSTASAQPAAPKPKRSSSASTSSSSSSSSNARAKATAKATDVAAGAQPKKHMRYLRDTDRRNIIKRIDNGEKQAALAREFGVTRAAICHMKKNRVEILARYELLVRTAQEMDLSENFVQPPGVELMVHELRASSVLLLLTTLRDSRTTARHFRRAAGRLMMILLEEALGLVATAPVDVITDTGSIHHGVERQASLCSVGVGAQGVPFLALFRQMEPDVPQGRIDVGTHVDERGRAVWHVESMELPSNIGQFKVLLFLATCDSGAEACKALEALVSVGVQQANISLVAITCSTDGLVAVCDGFPHVKIIAACVDGKVDFQTQTTIPGLGDFVARYNGD